MNDKPPPFVGDIGPVILIAHKMPGATHGLLTEDARAKLIAYQRPRPPWWRRALEWLRRHIH